MSHFKHIPKPKLRNKQEPRRKALNRPSPNKLSRPRLPDDAHFNSSNSRDSPAKLLRTREASESSILDKVHLEDALACRSFAGRSSSFLAKLRVKVDAQPIAGRPPAGKPPKSPSHRQSSYKHLRRPQYSQLGLKFLKQVLQS